MFGDNYKHDTVARSNSKSKEKQDMYEVYIVYVLPHAVNICENY